MRKTLPQTLILLFVGVGFGVVLNNFLPKFDLEVTTNSEYISLTNGYFSNQPLNNLTAVSLPFNFQHSLEIQTISATSLYAVDVGTKKEIASRNESEKRAIASITKLITALVALDNYSLTDYITISKPTTIVDRNLGLGVGDKVQVRELMEAMLVYSSNDSAEVLANECPCGGYSGFIAQMNVKAEVIGMVDSRFSNPSGYYDVDNYSTSKDLSRLASAFINSKASEIVTNSQVQFSFIDGGVVSARNLFSTNEILGKRDGVLGLKTGYTYASGPSFVSLVEVKGRKIVTVLLNSEDRFKETLELISLIEEKLVP